MRVLLLSQFYPPIIGGEERHVRNLGASLAARGHEVTVATLSHPGAPTSEMDGQVRVVRLRGTTQRVAALFSDPERQHAPPFPDPELVAALAGLVRSIRPDIVHAHNWMLHAYVPLRAVFRAPLVLTLHDYSLVCAKKNLLTDDGICGGPSLPKCLSCATRHYGMAKGAVTALATRASGLLARRAVDRFLAVSSAVAELNGLEGERGRCEVVPNFVPDDIGAAPADRHPSASELPSSPFLLFVGDLNRQKGVPVLLDAYRRLRGRPPLVLIGRSFADTPLDLPPDARLFNSWAHAAVLQAWRRCLFGIAPSVWEEPCATVVMEGMAQGKPMVVSDVGGMTDLVEDGSEGLVVRRGDAAALAAAMKRLLDEPGLAQELGAGALRKVERLKASAVVERIEATYLNLLAEPGRLPLADEVGA